MIRFSGQARVANQTAGITFTLHKSQQDNAALWTETQNVQLDGDGKYSVLLGAMKPLPVEVFTSGEAQWLAIHIQGQPDQRVLLVSVPYALKAAEAETLGGHAADEFITTEKLTQTLQQQVAPVNGTPGTHPALVGNVVSSGGTKFTDSTTDQVVLVTQNGSGKGLVATTKSGTAVQGTSASASGYGVYGFNSATTGTAVGVRGFTTSLDGIAVYGTSNAATGTGAGVKGVSSSPGGYGVFGQNIATTGNAFGFRGSTASTEGIAIYANATSVSGKTTGLLASVASPDGVAAVFRNSATGRLISGQSGASGTEVFAVDGTGKLVSTSVTASSVWGISDSGTGVHGFGKDVGIYGEATASGSTGVFGAASATPGTSGVVGVGANGVTGTTRISGGIGVVGDGGTSLQSRGVLGNGDTGVYGETSTGTGTGVLGRGAIGVEGESNGTNGDVGVEGLSSTDGGEGVYAYNSANGDGILAVGLAGYAGYFYGDVFVNGNLSKAGGSFKIDHPLDPANKYLYHSFVESPDMMNIYNGNVTTDGDGEAVVTLPEYFEALNRDFRYQLTVIGQFAQAVVGREISQGRFMIKTNLPNVKVSWQVTGVRQDAWANAHRIPVEQEKPGVERGAYLHPKLFGAPQEKSVTWARHPAALQQQKAYRERTAAAKR